MLIVHAKEHQERWKKIPYKFDPSKTPKLPTPYTEKSSWTESQIREYLSTSRKEDVEGIYKKIGGSYFQIAILADQGQYLAIVMETDQPNWFVGSVKAIIEKLRSNYYNTTYFEDNYSKTETISELDKNGVLKIGNQSYMKLFPVSKEQWLFHKIRKEYLLLIITTGLVRCERSYK